ncbi:MAG: alpha/beta hydrolase family protein [Armatimonadota bacterium]|nr:alpha/beta hydrolase family protein [Armatimonadota bacterium]
MIDERSTLQSVAGLHGFILAWQTADGVLQADYDYGVMIDEAPTTDGVARLTCTIVADSDAEALLELSALRDIRATLNGQVVAGGCPRIEPFGNAHPVTLRAGQNRLKLQITPGQINPRLSARLIAPDRLPLDVVSEVRPHWRGVTEQLRVPLPEGADVSLWHQWNNLTNRTPRMRLAEESNEAWRRWHDLFGLKLRELMGPTEPIVGAAPQLISSERLDGYRRDRLLLATEPNVVAPIWLLVPDDPNGAGIVAIHGHGYVYGETVGVAGDESSRQALERHNYAYGARYAEHGYTVVSPDMRNFGLRRDDERFRRDPCDAAAFRLQQFGINVLAGQVRDLRAALDHLIAQPTVASGRIGATGLSYGGRLTMYLSALDRRVACACVSGALNTFRERLTIDSSCGAQFVPGMLTYGDTPEVFGLIAPRPLLLELGTADGTSPEIFAMEAYAQIERIYRAANARNRLDLDVFESGHIYHGAKAFDWFDHWLLGG